ncbi:hypothetical protein OOU_Y34scaffold00535g14 [Pyricularia oryzae Y34]|uniref:Uncharacterized protein n=2 Tax=Pyricularia oryzae TaxID=318829 RepID=A0AA97NYI3_PYRO3|nr:hypothetical protein OOU_Y34scaffold00535g14 [Pyricularia oryzae Y34]
MIVGMVVVMIVVVIVVMGGVVSMVIVVVAMGRQIALRPAQVCDELQGARPVDIQLARLYLSQVRGIDFVVELRLRPCGLWCWASLSAHRAKRMMGSNRGVFGTSTTKWKLCTK